MWDTSEMTGGGARPGTALVPGGLPPPENMRTLEQLLEAGLLGRDEDALGEAVRQLRPAMRRLALRHVGSPEDAEDVIQDTWMAALSGVDRFEGRSLLSTWVLRILSYRARTHGKRASRSVPFSRAVSMPLCPTEAEPWFGGRPVRPDEAVEVREARALLARALRDLAPRQRRVFQLRELKGWSAGDVCERLGISAGNERLLLHRARTYVRNRLSAHFGRLRRTPTRESDAHVMGGWCTVRLGFAFA